jgi:hypothetical protein
LAQDYFSLKKEEIIDLGYSYKEEENTSIYN